MLLRSDFIICFQNSALGFVTSMPSLFTCPGNILVYRFTNSNWHILNFSFLDFYSELELKPQGNLTVTVLRANNLKNKELIGKSDPYVVVYIRPLFKVKTKVIENNLNPVWNQTFELIAEDKETQSLIIEV